MSDQTVQTIIVALLGAGGATFIWTIVKSYLAVRDSAEGREDKAIARLERYERLCRDQLEVERERGTYWYRRTATLEYILYQNGIEPPQRPPHQEPPSND